MDTVGTPELIVVLMLLFLNFGLAIWTLVDAARRPEWQFTMTDQSRALWIALPIVGMACCGIVSIVAFIVYMASVRPKLESARPPTWGAPPPPLPPTQWGPPGGGW